MAWLIAIVLGILTIVYLAMEVATYEVRGKSFRSFFKTFKRSLIFIIPLFAIAGVIYYGIIN